MCASAIYERSLDIATAIELTDRIEGALIEPALFEVSVTYLTNAATEGVVDVVDVHAGLADLFEASEPNLAASHLRRALNDIGKAITHLEKADVGKSQAGAVDALNRGSKELDEAATDLDNGEIDSAERHYDKASESFDKASAILS